MSQRMRTHPARLVAMPLVALQLVAAALAAPASVAAQVGTRAVSPVDSIDAQVATRRLARGTVLRSGDMTVARVADRRPSASGRAVVLPGWVTRRVLQAGEILRAPAVAPAPLVAAGQPVQFTYQQDGFALTLDGVAPVAGSLGDTIPVRLGARRRVSGIITGPARVVALVPPQVP